MVPKPGDECLGKWIVEDIHNIRDFKHHVSTDFFGTPMSEYESSWFALGNLMFKNMDDCHFTEVYHDISSYCSGTPE